MRRLLLVIPGHLGKDVGATATLESDGDGSPSFLARLQEERWMNLQQCIGFCLAHALSDIKNDLEVRLVIPKNIGFEMYDKGMIKIHKVETEIFSLQQRVNLVNNLNADVIEFHNNAAPFKASGMETLCFSKKDSKGSTSESFLISENILSSVVKNMNWKNRGVKPIFDRDQNKYIEREIFLLKSTNNNAIITEVGFLSDKKDLENIDVDLDSFNEQIGAAIWLGYRESFLQLKNNINP